MSNRRKKRRAAERRIAKAVRRTPVNVWVIAVIILIVAAVGLARSLG